MGNLLLYPESFLFDNPKGYNTLIIYNFLEGGNHARVNNDKIHMNNTLIEYEYEWGNFYIDLLYGGWNEIKNNPLLDWLPQSLHQAITSFFFEYPSGNGVYKDFTELENDLINELNGLLGCECKSSPDKNYVSCISGRAGDIDHLVPV